MCYWCTSSARHGSLPPLLSLPHMVQEGVPHVLSPPFIPAPYTPCPALPLTQHPAAAARLDAPLASCSSLGRQGKEDKYENKCFDNGNLRKAERERNIVVIKSEEEMSDKEGKEV